MTILSSVIESVASHATRRPPPLENGDQMDAAEFERRWDAMPELKKAELINGVVYMPSPVSFENHGEPHAHVLAWLGHYCAATPGVRFGDNSSAFLDESNVPQPDAHLMIDPRAGGQARTEKGYLHGAPELVVEVSASRTSIDVNQKLNLYRQHGVREYVVWRVLEDSLDWFKLERGEYRLCNPDKEWIFRSSILPGLWLDARALLSGDLKRVFAILDGGLATAEHQQFVQRLTEKRGTSA